LNKPLCKGQEDGDCNHQTLKGTWKYHKGVPTLH